jgi:hypothetical protein
VLLFGGGRRACEEVGDYTYGGEKRRDGGKGVAGSTGTGKSVVGEDVYTRLSMCLEGGSAGLVSRAEVRG